MEGQINDKRPPHFFQCGGLLPYDAYVCGEVDAAFQANPHTARQFALRALICCILMVL